MSDDILTAALAKLDELLDYRLPNGNPTRYIVIVHPYAEAIRAELHRLRDELHRLKPPQEPAP
jgi:hypothetical protein